MTNPTASPSPTPPETMKRMNPTAKFARIFDMLSLRDPTLNSTLYEDAEFAGLLRDIYAALHPQDAKESADAPKQETPEEQRFTKLWNEARARVAPLVKEALDAERWGSARIIDSRFSGGSGYYATCEVEPEEPANSSSSESVPSISGGVPGEERAATIAEVLKAHWLTSVDCDHTAGTDTARCFCTLWTGTAQPSVGAAVDQWIAHVVEMLGISRTITARPIFISAPYARALADRDATGGLAKVAEKRLPDVPR